MRIKMNGKPHEGSSLLHDCVAKYRYCKYKSSYKSKSWEFSTAVTLNTGIICFNPKIQLSSWTTLIFFLLQLHDATCVGPVHQSPGVMVATWWLFPATKPVYHLRGLLGFISAWLTLKHLILTYVCHLGLIVSWKRSRRGQYRWLFFFLQCIHLSLPRLRIPCDIR